MLRVAADIESWSPEFGHGGVIIDRAGLIDLAVETEQRRCVVALRIDKQERVAQGVGDGQIGPELAAIARIADGI